MKQLPIDIKEIIHDFRERQKELNCIKETIQVFNQEEELPVLLQKIANFIPKGMQYPDNTSVRIRFDGKEYTSYHFLSSEWLLAQDFETIDFKKGSIEIYYTKQFPQVHEGPFLKEERDLINNLAFIISSAITRKESQQLIYAHTERLKELRCINKTAQILRESDTFEMALREICKIIPDAWQYPEFTAVRITYDNSIFQSTNLKITPWVQKQSFVTKSNHKGHVEVYYLKEFPLIDEGPFMKEERHLINIIAGLISGTATEIDFQKLLFDNTERMKELDGINVASKIISEGLPLDKTLQAITDYLPSAWQYKLDTLVIIRYDGKVYISSQKETTRWVQKKDFSTIDNKKGVVEVYYTKEYPLNYEGPFLLEERNLLNNIAMLLTGYINSIKGRDFIYKATENQSAKRVAYSEVLEKKKMPLPPLQEFFDKQAIEKYIYLDMMRYKVKEILFVARLYDAFILENEGNIFEHFMGQIYQYSLFSLPRITAVSSGNEALELLESTSFDLVILMQGVDKHEVVELSGIIKDRHPSMPVNLLINRKGELEEIGKLELKLNSIDNVFVWSGDSKIIFAMVKSIEDRVNAEHDTAIGFVRIVLLIEDSPSYYSNYLTYLYSIVFEQVLQNISNVKSEPDKMSKIRSRPKIIHARNYEEASFYFNKFRDFLLCVISDIEFEKQGMNTKNAGFVFLANVRELLPNLPVLVQSSDRKNLDEAARLKMNTLHKHEGNIYQSLKEFVRNQLIYGDFIFRDEDGNELAKAVNLDVFMDLFASVPDASIEYHASRNEFSLWLMAKGEINLAKAINPVQVYHFSNVGEFRNYIIELINTTISEKKRGRVLEFNEKDILNDKNIVALAPGSLGGKGRGLAFINTMISNLDFSGFTDEINVRTPCTLIIGTDEYELFIKHNGLDKITLSDAPHNQQETRKLFINASLSPQLIEKLRIVLSLITKPIAVRSSSLFEDSLSQPFSGVFDTYILPNVHPDSNIRLEQVCQAVKLVYYSIFSNDARNYFRAVNHKIEEEKMAVIIQELVGSQHDNYFYPHVSGIAQSYNFYPVGHMKPEEGFASLALGLGEYIVKGGNSFRFSPVYPTLEIRSMEDIVKSSQTEFIAVDLHKEQLDLYNEGESAGLAKLSLYDAEKHGTLKHIASVYDHNNARIVEDLEIPGPRVINFSNILRYDYIPLAKTIESIMKTIREAYGAPVEIEFAVDLNKDEEGRASFFLLQIKPLMVEDDMPDVEEQEVENDLKILSSTSSIGHGKISNLQDVVFVKNESFDKMKTKEMVAEIEELNKKLLDENRKYILIGPGRWGTRDQFIGIPVVWSQISNAKVIIELSLEHFPLDASMGSHFFHNITSMGVGYVAIQHNNPNDFVHWELLNQAALVRETHYFRHVRFDKPYYVLMNGKKKNTMVYIPSQ